MDQMECISGKL